MLAATEHHHMNGWAKLPYFLWGQKQQKSLSGHQPQNALT